jgi:hypothetical protein
MGIAPNNNTPISAPESAAYKSVKQHTPSEVQDTAHHYGLPLISDKDAVVLSAIVHHSQQKGNFGLTIPCNVTHSRTFTPEQQRLFTKVTEVLSQVLSPCTDERQRQELLSNTFLRQYALETAIKENPNKFSAGDIAHVGAALGIPLALKIAENSTV